MKKREEEMGKKRDRVKETITGGLS